RAEAARSRLHGDQPALGQLQRGLRRRPGAEHAQATQDPIQDQRQGRRGDVRRERADFAPRAEVSKRGRESFLFRRKLARPVKRTKRRNKKDSRPLHACYFFTGRTSIAFPCRSNVSPTGLSTAL